jgi:Mrr N-terminal domain
MPDIHLTSSTYQRLLRRSTSFEDTAEEVIQNLLDQTRGIEASETSLPPADKQRATPGSILPVRAYWRPILEVITDAGGSAAATEVIDALEERMKDQLKPRDLEVLKSGELRWRNRARFARLRMRERGLLSNTSHRGLWEITDLGRRFLEAKPATIERLS